jgi:hypothetical protein
MRCGKCGFDNPAGMILRAMHQPAGADLSKCRFENPPGFKFCGQCTAPLNALGRGVDSSQIAAPAVRVTAEEVDGSAIDGERKTVTALFADIKGSTELMEDLDPEEARAIIDPALKLMIEAAHRYDGYVVQSTCCF